MDTMRRAVVELGIACGIVISGGGLFVAQDNDANATKARENWEQKRYTMSILRQVVDELDAEKELEIVDSQKSSIKSVFQDFRTTIEKLARVHQVRTVRLMESDLPESEKTSLKTEWETELNAQMGRAADEVTAKVNEILLPDQLKRIQQIVLQRQLFEKAEGDRTTLFVLLIDELELSQEDRKKFKNDLAEIREKFAKDLEELEQKHDQAILDALPSQAARNKVKELFGEIYVGR